MSGGHMYNENPWLSNNILFLVNISANTIDTLKK